MTTKSNCMNNNYEVENTNFDTQNVRRTILNDAVLENEELQRRLTTASSTVMEDNIMIESSKSLVCQSGENLDELWNEFQDKSKDLDSIKNFALCFDAVTDVSNENCESSKCSDLKELEVENKCIVENINKLEKWLNELNKNETCLDDQNQDYTMFSENKCVKFTENEQNIVKNIDEKEETRKSKSNIDNCIQGKEKKMQHIIGIDKLKNAIEIGVKYGKELNNTLCLQNDQNKKLTEVLVSCNKQIEMIKQKIEQKKNQSEKFTDQLQNQILVAENQRRDFKNKYKKSEKELEKLEHENKLLNEEYNRLQCKLDVVVKNRDKKHKLSMERIEKIQTDTKKLLNELNLTKQSILELDGKLTETRKMHIMEAENAHNLKIQFDNLMHKQSLLISPIVKSETSYFNRVLDNSKSNGEDILTMSTNFVGRLNDFEETNENFDGLIETCNSLIDYFKKK